MHVLHKVNLAFKKSEDYWNSIIFTINNEIYPLEFSKYIKSKYIIFLVA